MPDTAQLVMDALTGKSRPMVRLLRAGERLPAEFAVGFDQIAEIDANWCWVIERVATIEGCLLASPCHGAAVIWRLVMPVENVSGLRLLLRTFMRDCRARGLKGYITLVDSGIDTQGKLKKLMERAGAKVASEGMSFMAGPLLKEHS